MTVVWTDRQTALHGKADMQKPTHTHTQKQNTRAGKHTHTHFAHCQLTVRVKKVNILPTGPVSYDSSNRF